ncbi:MAG: hypothetical protein Q7K55_00340, partial [Candidatus Levybacteria bacterium]|nr:hypothetical protein [Candidatus Levybacteria bacterium]
MKKVLKIVLTVINALTRSIYLIVAIAIIFLVSYFLGFSYLSFVRGSDSMYHLSNIIWFNKFFPSIPYWYPLQNGGVVPIWGYPQLSYFIIIIIHKISGLSLVSLYQLFGLLSVPLTALGLYLFVWLRIKNQTVALIGAVFYILMPISWVWLFDWGFYTESTSYIFIFPTLIFYDIFFKSYLNGKIKWRERLSFLFAIIFLALMFLAHPSSFFATFAIIIIYSFMVAVFKEKKPKKVIKGLLSPIVIIICSILLLSFIVLDFRDYAKKTSSSSGSVSYTKEEMQKLKKDTMYFLTTPVDVVLGFTKLPPTDFKSAHNNIVVPQTVWLPAIAGGIVSIIYSPIVLALALIAAFPLLIFWQPEIGWIIGNSHIPFIGYFFHHRMLVLYLKLTIPIVGAFGIWGVFKFLLDLPTFWIKKGRIYLIKNLLIFFISSILSLVAAVFLIINFANKPGNLFRNTDVRYGPRVFDIRDPFFKKEIRSDACQTMQKNDPNRPKACDLLSVRQNLDVQQFISECNNTETKEKPEACELISKGEITQDQFKNFLKDCQKGKYASLCPFVKNVDTKELKNYLANKENWPKLKPINNFDLPKTRFSDFIALHNNEKMLRIDVSPYLGGVVQTLNLESEISQINLYAITLSLLGPYWGYEQQVLF